MELHTVYNRIYYYITLHISSYQQQIYFYVIICVYRFQEKIYKIFINFKNELLLNLCKRQNCINNK